MALNKSSGLNGLRDIPIHTCTQAHLTVADQRMCCHRDDILAPVIDCDYAMPALFNQAYGRLPVYGIIFRNP